ncbi:MAG: hypothetical protein WD056_00865 [Gemmatimonadota bacterium]
MSPPDRRAEWLATGAVGLVALGVLASVFTPVPHTGGDNASYLTLGYSLATGGGYTELWDPEQLPHTKYPPVFPALLALLTAAGATTWVGFKLLISVTLGAAVLLVLTWGAERRGVIAGAAVAILTLLSAGWLDAGRWILSEPLFLVWTFLALWAADRGVGRLPPLTLRRAGHRTGELPGVEEGVYSVRWILLAALAAVLAFFSRSAGLPLVLALTAVLALGGKRRDAALLAGGFLLLAGAWGIRSLGGTGEGAYEAEFWLVNPYQPELGTIGWWELPLRAWTNLRLYAGEILGGQWWGATGEGAAILLGVVLTALALWGWTLRVRLGAGVAEFFVPLYLGLILLWPEAWTGARFLLPLVPLILLYAGEALRYAGLTLGNVAATGVVALGVLMLLLPAIPAWLLLAEGSSDCRRLAEGGDVFACHPETVAEFREGAAWAGMNLPSDAVVLNRKPSIFFLMGGRPGRIYPFTRDPDAFLAEADRLGAEYLLFDGIDGISLFYLPAVLSARPLAFCHIRGWGSAGAAGIGTELFAILPPSERRTDGEVTGIPACPARYRNNPEGEPEMEGLNIPLFVAGAAEDYSSSENSP